VAFGLMSGAGYTHPRMWRLGPASVLGTTLRPRGAWAACLKLTRAAWVLPQCRPHHCTHVALGLPA